MASDCLHIWVPTNRVDRRGRYTHMDGWNEIKSAFESGRNVGSNLIREDVKRVATWTLLAMRRYGWEPMDATNASPCAVRITFVERDHKRDVGNIHGGAKYALDGLTARHKYGAGAIYDDSQRWLPRVEYEIDYVGKEYTEPGMAITVQRLS